jgi:hypothetical protein
MFASRILLAMLDRSGPFDVPRPRTTWQVEHCPLPKKIASPAFASPAAGAADAVAFSDRI